MNDTERQEKFAELHGGPLGGHSGSTVTKSKFTEKYFWPGMHADISEMVGYIEKRSHCRVYGDSNKILFEIITGKF